MPSIKNHILLRGATYHVRLDIPEKLQPIYSRRVLSKSLKTGDALLARELAARQVAEWKAEFRQLRDQQIRRGDQWKESIARSGEFYEKSRKRQIMHAVDGHPTSIARTPEEVDSILSALKFLFDEVDADRRAAGVPQADIDRANELVRQNFSVQAQTSSRLFRRPTPSPVRVRCCLHSKSICLRLKSWKRPGRLLPSQKPTVPALRSPHRYNAGLPNTSPHNQPTNAHAP